MSKSSDITRWNRAGLRRIRYVNGNAATLLEELRARLDERFNRPPEPSRWPGMAGPQAEHEDGEEPEPESETGRQQRLLAQYEAPRPPVPDWGWELARVLARAAHVLVEHVDAYANEGYLGTATQWESLRRLVEMIDYHPAPPASAFTPLVVHAKAGSRGRVDRGFALRHSPPDGGPPAVFETLDDLEVDASLNLLRPAGHGVNPDALPAGTDRLELEGRVSGLVVGEPLVLEVEGDDAPRAYVVEGVVQGEDSTTVTVTPPLPSSGIIRGRTRVHLRPKERLAPVGPVITTAHVGTSLRLAVEPRGLLAGDVITVSDGQRRCYRRVISVQGRVLELDREVGVLALARATVARPGVVAVAGVLGLGELFGTVEHQVRFSGAWARLNGQTLGDPRAFSGEVTYSEVTVVSAVEVPVQSTDEENRGHTLLTLTQPLGPNESPSQLENPQVFLVPPASEGGWAVDTFLQHMASMSRLPEPLWVEAPRGLAAGELVAVVRGAQVSWGRLASVELDAELAHAALRPADGWKGRGGEDYPLAETRVFSRFQEVARLRGWNRNTQPLSGTSVPLAAVPGGLTPGRFVVVRQEGRATQPLLTRVLEVGSGRLGLADPLPEGSTVDNLVLHANIVLAGHGERKPEQVLGSGDATRTGQRFVLGERDLSFIADATRASGVRADLDVRVGGRTWTQVESLRGSGPTDSHYTVRVVQEGALAVVFGDGRNGRRLPTGANNVRVSFRAGAGAAGNLAAGSLRKPVRPHPLVESVEQPLPAVGGNDVEGVESLRRNAPAMVLTLERAVSIEDFASLARGHSSVWQARAFPRQGAGSRRTRVEVVVVPATGGALGALKQSLTDFLHVHAAPGVEVEVSHFSSTPVKLDVELELDPRAYNPDAVVRAVRSALLDALSLRRRELGQPLYLSDVYKVVEAVEGVESSVCVIDETPGLQRKDAPDGSHIIHLDPEGQDLTVRFQEYSL